MKRKDFHPSKGSEEEVKKWNCPKYRVRNVNVEDYLELPIDISFKTIASVLTGGFVVISCVCC